MLTVIGTGIVNIPTDYIKISISKTFNNKDYSLLNNESNDFDQALVIFLKITKLKKDALTIKNISVFPNYDDRRSLISYSKQVRYELCFDYNQNVLANVINSLSTLKHAPQFNITFSSKNYSGHIKNAIEAACNDAHDKANAIASTHNIKLGKVSSIEYLDYDNDVALLNTQSSFRNSFEPTEGIICKQVKITYEFDGE